MATTAKKSCRLGTPNPRNRNGTDLTAGQPIERGNGRTTCSIEVKSAVRSNHARLWWWDAEGKTLSQGAFISLAVDELTRRTLKEHPDFKLPPDCTFDFTRV